MWAAAVLIRSLQELNDPSHMRAKLPAVRSLIRSSISLRSQLLLLVLGTLAPMIIFAVTMIVRLGHEERATFERGATERTRALSTAIDAELGSSIATLEALATSPTLTDDELDVFQERSKRILRSQGDWLTINLSAPSGEQVMNTQLPFGAGLPTTQRDSQSFEQVLRTEKPAIGNLVASPISRQTEFSVRVPVMRDGKIKYVLSAAVRPSSIDGLLAPQRLPPDWIGVVLDGNRRFVTRTVNPEGSLGQLASESLRSALDRSSEGWFRGSTVEGWDVYTPYNRSFFSGWTVALGIPADVVDATFRRSLIQVALFGGGLLALAFLIAWILSNQMAASIGSLAVMAKNFGSRNIPEKTNNLRTGIAEVDAVSTAFVTASRLIQEHSEERERAEERLQLALTSGNIGVYEWYPKTNELVWDDRVRAHWGLPPATPVNYEIFLQGLHPDDRLTVQAKLQHALDPKSDGQYFAEYRVIGIEDRIQRWIEARGQAVFEKGAALRLGGTTIDITERKAFENELERQVQERTITLQETIGELEAFSYSVSHDMRAPLRAMEGYAKALLADYRERLDAEAQHWLDRIIRSAQRLDFLIKDVLAYSRVAKEEIELSPVDLERLMEDILSITPEFQAPRAHITVEKPLHPVLGHQAYLTQCVTNLLGNAIKFVAAGVIPEIHVRSERLDGKVRVWFEDNGIGIDPAHHGRIFQIFGQVYPQESYSGTGIGLAIVRKAAQRMNGEVGVESRLQEGSRFWLILSGTEI